MMKQKAFFIIFKGLSMKQITQMFLEGESLTLKRNKLNISLVFISECYVKVPKTIRLNATLFYHDNS